MSHLPELPSFLSNSSFSRIAAILYNIAAILPLSNSSYCTCPIAAIVQ